MIITIGDVHGDFDKLYDGLKNISEYGTTFIQIGDFGLGFNSPINDYKHLTKINDYLFGKQSMMYVIRGNHDNPSFWTPDGQMEFSNIKFVQDNTVLELEGNRCLFAGGAPSIDRKGRVNGVSFWKNEQYTYSTFDGPIDIVFTHDVYHGISNYSVYNGSVDYYCFNDTSLRNYLIDGQMEMEKLYNRVMATNDGRNVKWYHGHYHTSSYNKHKRITVISLSILEFKEIQ